MRRAINVKPMKNYLLLVKFDNGETIDLISSNYWKELAK